MITLYPHQQRFIDKNPNRALLVWEGGTGKTYAACAWLKLRPKRKAFIVCPKALIQKWKDDLKKWGIRADIYSRDEVKTAPNLLRYNTLILDEAQDFASPLFERSKSQRSHAIFEWVRQTENPHVLLLTATPVRSTPWNIHTLATYLRIFWPIREFKEEFFNLTKRYGRIYYDKKPGWQKLIRPYIEYIADIVLMKDCVEIPTQHHHVIRVPWTKELEKKVGESYAEPVALWHERHRLEQSYEKWKELQKILDKYRKVIVVCEYRSQIDDYVHRIGEERQVFVLNGSTKNQEEVIKGAQEADDCVFIVQASMGAGFDADHFSVVVFASMSFKYVDYAQMKYRVKRIHNLHENTFFHLLGGKCDEAVYQTIQQNKDFDVHEYLQNSTRPHYEQHGK